MESAYYQYRWMLWQLVHRFIAKHGGGCPEDLFCVAEDAFIEAWLEFNERKAKFSTFLWIKVWRALQSDLRRRLKEASRYEPLWFTPKAKPQRRLHFVDLAQELSLDSIIMVRLVLDSPHVFRRMTRRQARFKINYTLLGRGWTVDRIEDAFATVGRAMNHWYQEN